jgi:uncharacterized protein YjlB
MVGMKRRTAAAALAAMGSGWAAPPKPETLLLKENAAMPNNAVLPVLLWRGAIPAGVDAAEWLEKRFAASGWPPAWRNGVYPYHHYHVTAHEALGFARGEAKLLLGGPLPGGREITVRAGDVALLPCGTGHCRVAASADFLVVGAYTLGQRVDLWREAPDAAAQEAMRRLPFPERDPLGGTLADVWRYAPSAGGRE